jgi:hypothetical protein
MFCLVSFCDYGGEPCDTLLTANILIACVTSYLSEGTAMYIVLNFC